MNPLETAGKIIQNTGDLPPMPQIAMQVTEMTLNPDTSANDLSKAIHQDQSLAARVLKIANSSFYARQREISNLPQAIVTMGFNALRNLVMAASVHDLLSEAGPNAQPLWEHSLSCGLASRAIAKSIGSRKVEESFLAGLLHDVGKAILLTRMKDEESEIFDAVAKKPDESFADLETDKFGFDHSQLGQLLARHWKFAPEIEEAIGHHHYPDEAQHHQAMAHVVALGNALCHKLGLGPRKIPDLELESHESAIKLAMDDIMLKELLDEVREGFNKAGEGLFS